MAIDNPSRLSNYEGNDNLERDPDEWITGGEPMTDAQASYLKTLSKIAGEEFDPDLTKAEAARRIDELQQQTGRGQPARWRTERR